MFFASLRIYCMCYFFPQRIFFLKKKDIFFGLFYILVISVADPDPDPHGSALIGNSDQDPHQSKKPDPDPHQI